MSFFFRSIDKIVGQRATTGNSFIENFDGLRAVAALMVLSMHLHTIPNLAGGTPGVWLFFTLSGYLLYSGFDRFTKQFNSQVIIAYLVRRVFRIMPLYLVFIFSYAYLLKYYWSPYQADTWFLSQLFFLKPSLHLWTVNAEMIFYFMLPIIFLILIPLKSDQWRLAVLLFFSLVFVGIDKAYDLSFPVIRDFIATFLLGMAALHFRQYIREQYAPFIAYTSFASILFLSAFVPWNEPVRHFFGLHSPVDMYAYGYVFYPLCFLLVASLSRFRSRFWGNRWLRLIGVCGYGVYLWHPLTIELAQRWTVNPFIYQVTAYVFTILLAVPTYLLVEKPGITLGRYVSGLVRKGGHALGCIRPAWLVLAVFCGFLAVRQTYVLDNTIHFQLFMWSPGDTVARIYLSDDGRYSEKLRGEFPLLAKQWQPVYIPFRGRRVEDIRFDPGALEGEYRLKEFKVKFPFQEPVDLDLKSFEPVNGISSVTMENDYLKIIAEENTTDSILLYKGKNQQLMVLPRYFILIVTVAGTLFILLLFRLMDVFLVKAGLIKFERGV